MTIPTHSKFISLEGGEGAGKTTVLTALREALTADGLDVVTTREPGGTSLGEQLRALLLDPDHAHACAEAELLMMFAARAQHLSEVIRPALARGAVVVCDRFTDSSYAYQGAGRGLDVAKIGHLERDFIALRPGLTLLLDLAIQQGRARAQGRGGQKDKIESEHDDFFERVRAGFHSRAAEDPARFRVLDATQPADAVAAEAVRQVRQVLRLQRT